MTIYDRVRELCDRQQLSIATVEDRAGLGHATIRKWDSSVPKIDTLVKVAKVLNVPVTELIEQ